MPAYFNADDCDLEEFKALTRQSLQKSDVPHATNIERNVVLYDMSALRDHLANDDARRALMAEWSWILGKSSGALVLQNAYEDTAPIDAATKAYLEIIAAEKAANATQADHFAEAGNNDRVWNSLQKLCVTDPQTYADYFSNTAIDAVSEAWLGPYYQMTAQVNLVRPGGKAQKAHRDYHLGFQTNDISQLFPAHAHDLSPVLTLQGGIAHCDMPVESGPTKLLPFSQLYRAGYTAWRREDFRAYFEENYVQLPLAKGDAIFFSPALFHGAGDNVSKDVQRMVNLLQVSSAFGRSLENINREEMCRTLYPVLKASPKPDADQRALIAATAEGYSFPTNLDSDPPVGGLAPETQQALFHRALSEGWVADKFNKELLAQSSRKQA